MDKSKGIIDGIYCNVTSCSYNSSKKCAAEQIHVGSKSSDYAEYADCVTYRPKTDS